MKILVIDDEPNVRKLLVMTMAVAGHQATAVSNCEEAIGASSKEPFDVAFVDLHLGTDTGLDVIPKLLAQSPWLRIIVVTGYAAVDTAVAAIRRGAVDYIPKPFTPDQIRIAIGLATADRAVTSNGTGTPGNDSAHDHRSTLGLQSDNVAMRRTIELARLVAASDTPVLLTGETGTGKTILAAAIHRASSRAGKPFATVSCPTLSPSLLESELFGHVKGAFTGAVRDAVGRIAAAEGGTLFLDEIGDLPLALQPKLLRFLQDRTYERLGDHQVRHADVRLVTATHVDLAEAVRNQRFREDLLYRINVVQIDLPPLRRRREDIPGLARQVLRELKRRPTLVGFTDRAIEALQNHDWPGNIRDLRNVIERAAILCSGDRIDVHDLPEKLGQRSCEPTLGDPVPFGALEAVHIRRLIAASKSIGDVAAALGIDVTTLWRKRKKFRL